MNTITDGTSSTPTPSVSPGRREPVFGGRSGSTDSTPPHTIIDHKHPEFRQRYAEREQHFRQADAVRRTDRAADRLSRAEDTLQQVKLYPPYPADEPLRAKAIRQFNGLTAEAQRLLGDPPRPTLPHEATAEQIDAASEALTTTQASVAHRREALGAAGPAPSELDEPQALALSEERGQTLALGHTSIGPSSNDVLRTLI